MGDPLAYLSTFRIEIVGSIIAGVKDTMGRGRAVAECVIH